MSQGEGGDGVEWGATASGGLGKRSSWACNAGQRCEGSTDLKKDVRIGGDTWARM